jgi:hypothetical protein
MAGYFMFRHAGTEVDECFIDEDNICRLIINVKPKLKLIRRFVADCFNVQPCYCKYFCYMPYFFVSVGSYFCMLSNFDDFIIIIPKNFSTSGQLHREIIFWKFFMFIELSMKLDRRSCPINTVRQFF